MQTTTKKIETYIYLSQSLRYELQKHYQNINDINHFLLEDPTDENIKEYHETKQNIEKLIDAKESILNRTETFLFDNCEHEWERDFNETPINATVKINAFKVCKKCGIMRRI